MRTYLFHHQRGWSTHTVKTNTTCRQTAVEIYIFSFLTLLIIVLKSWKNLQMTSEMICLSRFQNSSFDPKQSFLIWDGVEKSDDNRTTVPSWFPTVSHRTIQQLGHGLNIMNIWYVQTITWPNLIMGLERPFETEFSSFVILRHTQAVYHFGRILKK